MPAFTWVSLFVSWAWNWESCSWYFFSRCEVNKIWRSEPWLSFHCFWMEEKHLNGGKGRGWHKLGAWNSGNDGITIHGYLQSVHSQWHWGASAKLTPKPMFCPDTPLGSLLNRLPYITRKTAVVTISVFTPHAYFYLDTVESNPKT